MTVGVIQRQLPVRVLPCVQLDGVRHRRAGLWQQVLVYDVVVEVAGNHGGEGLELQLESEQAAAVLWGDVVQFENVMHCPVPAQRLGWRL